MTLKELAAYFRVSPAKLAPYLTLRGKKRIAARKIGRKWEISRQSAHDWLLTIYEEHLKGAKARPPTARKRTKSKMSTSRRNGKNPQRKR